MPELSIVVPAHNEAANLSLLIAEIKSAVIDAGVRAEVIIVDDGSDDGSLKILQQLAIEHAFVLAVGLAENHGQSLAIGIGIQHARADVLATLDADLQNDPADLPAMLSLMREHSVAMVQGFRANRQDTWSKRTGSRIARAARRFVLNDPVHDTGCSTRVVATDIACQWPLHLHGMHRFLPAYSAMLGASIIETPVNHRARAAGVSHYGSLRRGFAGIVDLLAVRWMMSRHRSTPTTSTLQKYTEAKEQA